MESRCGEAGVVAPSGLPGKTARIKQNFVAIRSQFKNLLAAANSRLMFSFFLLVVRIFTKRCTKAWLGLFYERSGSPAGQSLAS